MNAGLPKLSQLEPLSLPPPLPAPAKPISETERIQTLDVLRGVALFGILFVNIQDFAMVPDARYDPAISGGGGLVNELVWLGTFVFADTKFLAIFTVLFGAGIALADRRRRAKGERRALAYHRRLIFLLLLGLAHSVLVWRGDILYYYAFWALALYFAPRIPTPILFGAGGLFFGLYSVQIGKSLMLFRGIYSWISVEVYRGSWREQVAWRLEHFVFDTALVPFQYAFHLLGLMMIGMALLKCGFLEGRYPTRTYVALFLTVFPGGLLLVYMGTKFQPGFESFAHTEAFFWGSAYLSLAYMGAAVSASKLAPKSWPTRAVAAVGRMALTNYLMHSVICTTIFYGYGFGFYENLDRTGQLGTVVAICLAQLIISPLWLKAYRYGPFEWLWRSVTYWRWQPIRRSKPIPPAESV